MRVVFDSQAFRLERRGGISRYIVSLARALLEARIGVHVVAPIHSNAHLREFPAIPKTGRYVEKPMIHRRVEGILNSALEPLALRMACPDVLHATFYGPSSSGGAKARVLTVHDMIHERFRHWHPDNPLMAMKARAVAEADHVICISKTTQKDLCEILDVPEHKTSVVYHGGFRLDTTPSQKFATGKPYVLFVGQRHRHKNFNVLLDAFGVSPTLRSNFRLIAFGGSPFTAQERLLAERAGLTNESLVQVSGDDELLASYYSQAVALVYPSLYEGFGFPLLEAMALKCPVITTNVSCMPEIAADAALYFSPDDPSALAGAIERVFSDIALRVQLQSAGLRREADFTWELCGKQTLIAYSVALAQR